MHRGVYLVPELGSWDRSRFYSKFVLAVGVLRVQSLVTAALDSAHRVFQALLKYIDEVVWSTTIN